ncbi:MAG: class I SAM-dependent methyltransferase [Acidobacteria bacterium]|nr:class I SAM-dependent methyltransferase [Acidobacteriota bacterium]
MSFDAVAVDFDRMIDWPARLGREIPPISAMLRSRLATSVIDFGSGTGRHAIELSRCGFAVSCVDRSRVMRRLARSNAFPLRMKVVESLDRLQGRYDAVITIGNTLPSIRSAVQLARIFKQMRRLTMPDGLLLIQVRNYEKLLRDRVETTGLRDTGDVTYFRAYHAEDSPRGGRSVHLHLFKIDRRTAHPTVSGSIARLRGWSRSELRRALRSAGYRGIAFHSDYQLRPFSQASPDIVVVASA